MTAPLRDVVVIGGSAGAVQPLLTMLAQLPPDLPAAVAITLHRPPTTASSLAQVFARRSAIEVIEPRDGERFTAGRVYLAPQDLHMSITRTTIRLSRTPRQHHTRPAIDPLFVSAAESCGDRVVGTLLTGNLSDGVSGLIRIKERGGISLVQDPRQAQFPSMPLNALIYDHVDLVLQTRVLAAVIAGLVRGATVDAISRTEGARRARAADTGAPSWLPRGHRLR